MTISCMNPPLLTFLANNYRMTELQGAVALAQLGKLEWIISRRRSWCTRLTQRLSDLEGVLLPKITPHSDPSWWFYMLRVVSEHLHTGADEFAVAPVESYDKAVLVIELHIATNYVKVIMSRGRNDRGKDGRRETGGDQTFANVRQYGRYAVSS